MATYISSQIKEHAPLILDAIKKSSSVLLHCHPSPDPDSVGSALAMKFVIEQLGKKATVIKGDSEIPQAFMHFPGAQEIVMKSYWEINPADYDLFIIVDSSITGVSRIKPVELPSSMKVINIDHHKTNTGSGSINIIDSSYPATGQLLFDILTEMGVTITPEIASNLYIGMYTDTGGFKYEGTTARTYEVAGKLVDLIPSFTNLISRMENSNTVEDMAFTGLALSSIRTFSGGKLGISTVSYQEIQDKHIPDVSLSAGGISSVVRSVAQFDIVAACIEARPGKIRMSFRTNNADRYDVSKIAVALGGGGHRAAAGAVTEKSLEDTVALIVEKVKELYNL